MTDSVDVQIHARLSQDPEFVQQGVECSNLLHELCKLQGSDKAFTLGELLRTRILSWSARGMTRAYEVGYLAGRHDASISN